MGTRADFWIGQGAGAQYLGSIFMDGYPESIDKDILRAETEEEFREAVEEFTQGQRKPGRPDFDEEARLTDYFYCFLNGEVRALRYGKEWLDPLEGKRRRRGFALSRAEAVAIRACFMAGGEPGTTGGPEARTLLESFLGKDKTQELLTRMGEWVRDS